MRIALLEDDASLATILAGWLEEAGHHLHMFAEGRSLQRTASRESFDLFILDWQVPEMSGPEFLAWLRDVQKSRAPVLFATARDAEEDIVAALKAGADDYMIKPVRRYELLARVAALHRRSVEVADSEALTSGHIALDITRRRAMVAGEAVELTDKEFDVAVFLLRHVGNLLSRGHISESVWGRSADVPTRTVDTHMSRLRKKLRLSPEHGFRLTSVYNFGYRLDVVEPGSDLPSASGQA